MFRNTSRQTVDPMIALFAAAALVAGLLVAGDAEAQAVDIALIKDINLTTADALTNNPYQAGFAELNGVFYFVADAGSTGQELWRSDGTPGGTSLVKDIYPGTQASQVEELVVSGGKLFFTAYTQATGRELWVSDGTEVGTTVLEIRAGTAGATPQALVDFGGTLFLNADDGINGQELWTSDGTPGGTSMLKDIRIGAFGSSPYLLTLVGGTLFFRANDGVGDGLFVSDGTAANTVKLMTVSIGNEITAAAGLVWFEGDDGTGSGDELWRSDGTVAGTYEVADINPGSGNSDPMRFTGVGGTVFFSANDGASGAELWKTDGTGAGTVRVKDIQAGSGWSDPTALFEFGGALFFRANDGATGSELWTSDGTDAGTTRVADIYSGTAGSYPLQFTDFGGALFFSATDEAGGRELWTTDGTGAGTTRVVDILAGPEDGLYSDASFLVFGSELIVAADSWEYGRELWTTDGTGAGTTLVHDINTNTATSGSGLFAETSGTVIFMADDGVSGRELWTTDGTEAGTSRVIDLNPGSAGTFDQAQYATTAGGVFFFGGTDGVTGTELWTSDGTAGGTVQLRDINTGPNDSDPKTWADLNGVVHFEADDGLVGSELWRSDGTPAGTYLVKNVNPGVSGGQPLGCGMQYPEVVGDTLFFSGIDWNYGRELWKSDGTEAGTVMVKEIWGGTGSSYPSYLTALNDIVLFSATGSGGTELWKSDGTEAGTVRVKDIRPGTGNSSPSQLTTVGDVVFFGADDGVNDNQLWKSDGTEAGTVMVKEINPSGYTQMTQLMAVGDVLFFWANDGSSGYEPWISDGTETGTQRLLDISPGSGSSGTGPGVIVGEHVYFSADDGVNGRELWRTDLTPAGTELVVDVRPGPLGSYASPVLYADGVLYFVADNGTTGYEPWRLQIPTADLQITKSDGLTGVVPGQELTYAIVVSSPTGPSDIVGAVVTDTLPAELSCSWTCDATGSASCTAGPVAGNIDDTVDLPVGETLTYTLECTLSTSAAGTLENTASVAVPDGAIDPNPANDGATDTDQVLDFDAGDAPDPSYPTLVASNGARHGISGGLYLGASVDADADGQPSALADGDDVDGSDDEDGVVFTSGLGRGLNAYLNLAASAAGLLNAWVDFNADGDWLDAGEQIFTDQALAAGVNPLSFPVPADATLGATFARFRIDSTGGLSPDGIALDGEVEDELVEIVNGADVAVEMSASINPAPSGRALTWTATVTNNGPLTATSVTLADTLPAEVIFISSTPGSPDCTFATDTLTCDLGALAPHANTQVTIDVTLDHPVWGGFSNTATVSAAENDPIPANNSATVNTTIGLFLDDFESGDTSAWD